MPDPAPPPTPERDAELLRQFLAGRDATCACGYSLRDLTIATCPECGESIRIGLVVRRTRFWLWFIILLGCIVGFAFSATLCGIAIHQRVQSGAWPNIDPFIPSVLGLTLLGGAGIITACSLEATYTARRSSLLSAGIGAWVMTVLLIVQTFYRL